MTGEEAPGTRNRARGLMLASLGMLAFSFTFPATATALHGFSPYLIGIGRAVAAAALAGCWLAIRRVPFPARSDLAGLLIVAAGVVIGFPLLTALALQDVSSSHAAVVVGLLPVATAVFGALRAGERPGAVFWAAAVAGAVIVAIFVLRGGPGRFGTADLLLLGSLIAGGAAYAEGAMLARRMPGWQVISWALVLALPVTAGVTAVAVLADPPHPTPTAAAGFGYVSVFSMYLGFFAWYRGLADAGVARASQVQLAQPLLTVLWSALLLGERLTWPLLVTAGGVLACVGAAQRTRGGRRPAAPPPSQDALTAAARADPAASRLSRSPEESAPDPGDPGTAGSPPR